MAQINFNKDVVAILICSSEYINNENRLRLNKRCNSVADAIEYLNYYDVDYRLIHNIINKYMIIKGDVEDKEDYMGENFTYWVFKDGSILTYDYRYGYYNSISEELLYTLKKEVAENNWQFYIGGQSSPERIQKKTVIKRGHKSFK